MKVTISGVALVFAVATKTAQAYDVEFFYTETLDLCEYKDLSLKATSETERGGVCAYVAEKKRIYACPAPGPHCWSLLQNCERGSQTPGSDQILCSGSGITWCCANDETCAINRENVCVSNFTSPVAGIDIAQANSTELQVLGVSNVTATSQTVDPTPFSTLVVSTSSTSLTTSTAIETGSTSPANATNQHSSDKVSAGAIAGIVIGIVGGLVFIGALFIVCKHRILAHKSNTDTVKSPYFVEADSQPGSYANEKHHAVEEIGDRTSRVVEMPNSAYPVVSELPSYDGSSFRHEMTA